METLCDPGMCCGCTACAAICPKNCIEMIADESGFLHPVVDTARCVNCALCRSACPIINSKCEKNEATEAYAALSKDETIRLASSSGGVFTELARATLQAGGVVFGAAYNEQFEVVHKCARDESELAALRGAKYAQSDLRGIFSQVKEYLVHGMNVLFFGTPCQVAGLKSYLKKDYDTLLTVDCVCHSVPSPIAWREYVKYRAQQDNAGDYPKTINLRSKKTGWSRYSYTNLFEYESGKSSELRSHESLFMNLFVHGYICRESCENCQFKGYSRVSDLTLGDFWGIWDIMPEMDDNKGTSVVLVQSERGKAILESLKDSIQMLPVSLEDASKQNPAIIRSFSAHAKRLEALLLIKDGKIGECEKWFTSPQPSQFNRAKKIVKRFFKKFKQG